MSATGVFRHRGKSGQQLRRGAAAAVIAMVVAATVLAMPEPAAARAAQPSIADVTVTRYGGADRYATSLLVAEAYAREAGGKLDTVVLVSGESWTSAVVAAPYAAKLGAPLLMTPPDQLRDDAAEFLQRVDVSTVHLLRTYRTDGFISFEVDVALTAHLGIDVEYIIGGDQYYTSGVVAKKMGEAGIIPGFGRTAIVANGEAFADALVAGPFAARGGHPVLLTPRDELDGGARAALLTGRVEHVIVMGGTAAISAEVEKSVLKDGIGVTRIAGATRYGTAIEAARFIRNRYSDKAGEECFTSRRIGVARAQVPFDSFSAGPLLGLLCAPLVLADPSGIPASTAAHLDWSRGRTAAGSSSSFEAYVFGGEAAVSTTGLTRYLEAERVASFTGIVVGTRPVDGCGGEITDGPVEVLDGRASKPVWSPDCTKIGYHTYDQIWTMNADGTGQQMLVRHEQGGITDLEWSPDGDQIAYSFAVGVGLDRGAHIWSVATDGTGAAQLTFGAVYDDSPSWSPDSGHLAFRRIRHLSTVAAADFDYEYELLVMSSSGFRPVPLTGLGANLESLGCEFLTYGSPRWSPTGDWIGFIAESGTVAVIAPDGSEARPVAYQAWADRGLSWAPDGQRLAFMRYTAQGGSVFFADIEGLEEEVVTSAAGASSVPDWSPDGKRLVYSAGGTVSVTGARGTSVPASARTCRPRGFGGVSAGFPVQDDVPTTGVVRIGVLFMDFSDAQAEHSTQRESRLGLQWAENYLEAVSYGRLDVEFAPLHRWLRAEQPFEAYMGPTAVSTGLVGAASEHAVEVADPEFDFTQVDLVLTVFPGSHFGGGNALGSATADGLTVSTTRVNTFPLPERREPLDDWGYVAAHEIAHNLGLVDLYPYGRRPTRTLPDDEQFREVEFGLMGLQSYAPVSRSSETHPTGEPEQARGQVRGWWPEPLAWSRWQMGWLFDSQVRCIVDGSAEVTLSPVARPGDGVAMAAVPLNAQGALVVESRRPTGYDSHNQGSGDFGVLVYTVDAARISGYLPIRVAGDLYRYPLLEAGESVTLRGYTVAVVSDDGDTHTVTITRNS
ncbi:cell wall-binding repeat-containing protein [Candidatus Poriferisodalis sp.]|uniref:cell wall-binding repeat-containing protein n=1 Tax=Candidatus Poriferisodalis sp. TaxID=3101277 RepID=UPI003AF97190